MASSLTALSETYPWGSMSAAEVLGANLGNSAAASRSAVPDLVASAARASPEAIALRGPCGEVSYGALDARANQLAAYLRSLGAGPGTIVGVLMDRSFDQITSLLAAMKSGCAFLPLDTAWPHERMRAILADAGASVLLAGPAIPEDLGEGRVLVRMARDARIIDSFASNSAPVSPGPDDLAYVIYTSGSTGTPKGVEITHGNLLSLVSWHRDAFGIGPADRASHLAGLGFDAAVWEVWPYLSVGAGVCLADEMTRTSPELLGRWLVAERVSVAFVPTALAEPMIAAEWPADTALRFMLTGADVLRSHPRPGLPFALVNNYGPTECTVVATSGVVPPSGGAEAPTIGWPIAGTCVHVLDERGMPVPAGELGELHIGGEGVGRGYRNRPELTVRHFLPDPFAGRPGARMYRTGDLGRMLADGQIAFGGRIDDQEKIRGHRVEPEEVARALNRQPGVTTSVVVARPDASGNRQLVAYVVPAPDAADVTAPVLHAALAAILPSYMVPAAFVRLDALPLTTSGKIDRRALPEPDAANSLDARNSPGEPAGRAPETPTEERLAAIIGGLLGVEAVGADDNFFLLGGHSLLGTQVVLRAREAFGVELTLRHLFEAHTVATLAAKVEDLLIAQIESMSEEEVLRLMGGAEGEHGS